MVTTTGRIRPSCPWVWALNPLQNSMMFTPCCPSAGPTGGEGFPFPAGICNLTTAWTFFTVVPPGSTRARPAWDVRRQVPPPSYGPLRVDVLDGPLEVHERSVDDPHLV